MRYMEQLLIIEDDIGLNQGLCKALKADDRQMISCHNLKTAREQLLCGSVSLILLDINLPDGSGLELLREVKENTPYIPVILLTANDTDLDIVDGLERGADDYITKPFSLSVLRARVNTQLRKQASNHKNAYLDRMGDQYDLIILDPPAFAKHKDALRNALQGYRKLNAKAFEKIKPGGILFTFSCSQVVTKDNFRTAVFTAAAMSGRSVRILHQLTQPADHPVNIYHPEGEYLKGLVLYVE